MTPREKAEELIMDYRFLLSLPGAPLGESKHIIAKKCAVKCVNEIIKAGKQHIVEQYFDDIFWTEVIKELENL